MVGKGSFTVNVKVFTLLNLNLLGTQYSMTRSELIKSLASLCNDLPESKIDDITKYVFSLMTQHLSNGDRIEIRGFGSFGTKTREARTARNPKTGETIQVAAKRVVQFKAGKELKERLNSD